jgi:hypothetical protein
MRILLQSLSTIYVETGAAGMTGQITSPAGEAVYGLT